MKSLLGKLGVILFIITLAIFAYGEERKAGCAWVLWESQYLADQRTGSWMINSAFPNYELCMKELKDTLEHFNKSYRTTPNAKVTRIPNGLIVELTDETGKEKRFQYLYKCLPDTIDPRK